MLRRTTGRCLALAGIAAALGACGGSSPAPAKRTPPDLAAFLQLPVATPSSCPSGSNGTGTGRISPWAGHVDVSVFVADSAGATTRRALHDALVAIPHVAHVYTETKSEAYEEFRRLYTCSAGVPRSAVRASYRLVLGTVTTPQRDALVRQIYRLPGVGDVSCDPVSPCVDVAHGG
jgi:hypothetical protein